MKAKHIVQQVSEVLDKLNVCVINDPDKEEGHNGIQMEMDCFEGSHKANIHG